MKSPVSRAMPNRPSIMFVRTSSEVWPNSAVSTSWMAAALFIATAVMTFFSMRSMMTGASPTLTTCAPIIRMTGFSFFCGLDDVMDEAAEVLRHEDVRQPLDEQTERILVSVERGGEQPGTTLLFRRADGDRVDPGQVSAWMSWHDRLLRRKDYLIRDGNGPLIPKYSAAPHRWNR